MESNTKYAWLAFLISLILFIAGISYLSIIKERTAYNYKPTSGYLLFTKEWRSIWLMDSNGINQTCIANPGYCLKSPSSPWNTSKGSFAQFYNPKLSPDGEKVAYISDINNYMGRVSIYIVDKNGNNITKIEIDYFIKEFFWSPDGKKILTEDNSKIYIYDIESGKSELILSSYQMNTHDLIIFPGWSPDGKSIIFQQDGYSTRKIGILNLSTKQIKYISPEDPYDIKPKWTSYRNKILFIGQYNESRNLYSMNSDGSNRKIIIPNIKCSYSYSLPNSKGILVYSDGEDIFTIDVMGNNKMKLLDSDDPTYNPVWSLNENHIAYLGGWFIPPNVEMDYYLTEIFKLNIYTKKPQQLTDDNDIEYDLSWIDI